MVFWQVSLTHLFAICSLIGSCQVRPFQFLDGSYSNERYDADVKTCAQGFEDDQDLKLKVSEAANEIFKSMAASPSPSLVQHCKIVHGGITFTVTCGTRKAVADEPSLK
jgi:hypothetical protein